MTKDDYIARSFRAISHPSRARLFRLLIETPEIGSSYRSLQTASGLGDATLIHHLREMERCGLVRRQRRGPYTRYRIDLTQFSRALGAVHTLTNQLRFYPAA